MGHYLSKHRQLNVLSVDSHGGCKFNKQWYLAMQESRDCCIVNQLTKNEIIFWKRTQSTYIQVIRYNADNQTFGACENHQANNIFGYLLAAAVNNLDIDEDKIRYNCDFYNMIKYPYSDNLFILIGRCHFSNEDVSAVGFVLFCALIDVNTMETIHFEILDDTTDNWVNWKYIVQHKNIAFAMESDLLSICSIGNINNHNNNYNSEHNTAKDSEWKLITVAKQIQLGLRRYYDGCGLIIRSINKVANSDNEINVELLLFASHGFSCEFIESFVTVNVRCKHILNGELLDVDNFDVDSNVEDKDFSLLKMGLKTPEMKLKNEKFINFMKNKNLVDFRWRYIKNRYLIIIGGGIEYSFDCTRHDINTEIITFDFKTKTWTLLKDEYGLGLAPFFRQYFSILINNKIFSFGDCNSSSFNHKTHCIISLVVPLDWKMARIIWIGYEKENENFALLPKCLVKTILEYSKRYIFDDGNGTESLDETRQGEGRKTNELTANHSVNLCDDKEVVAEIEKLEKPADVSGPRGLDVTPTASTNSQRANSAT